MRPLFVFLIITSSFSLHANDAIDTLYGSIISKQKIDRVRPVRVHLNDQEISTSNPNEAKFGDTGKDAHIDVDGSTVHWGLVFSYSGAGAYRVTDLVVRTADDHVFEEIEMSDPRTVERAGWRNCA